MDLLGLAIVIAAFCAAVYIANRSRRGRPRGGFGGGKDKGGDERLK